MKLKERFMNTEDFYYRIVSSDYPIKYKKKGIYMKNIFNIYGYSRELVLDTIDFFDYLSKHNFDFRNMDYFIITDFNSFIFQDYHALFELYDNIFIKKSYFNLYNMFDEFKNRLNGENFKIDDTYSDLPYLFLIHMNCRISVREYYLDNNMERFVEAVLKIITILYWINNKKEIDELNNVTYQILLNNNFIDRCIMKGYDINSVIYHQVNYLANAIYNKEFVMFNKKLIK